MTLNEIFSNDKENIIFPAKITSILGNIDVTSNNGRVEIFSWGNYISIKIDGEEIIDNECLSNPLDCKLDSIEVKLMEALVT